MKNAIVEFTSQHEPGTDEFEEQLHRDAVMTNMRMSEGVPPEEITFDGVPLKLERPTVITGEVIKSVNRKAA